MTNIVGYRAVVREATSSKVAINKQADGKLNSEKRVCNLSMSHIVDVCSLSVFGDSITSSPRGLK